MIAPVCLAQEPAPPPRLELATVLPDLPGAEIIAIQADTRRAVLTLGAVGAVEILDLATPEHPRSLGRVELGLARGEELTSVALPPRGDWFLAVVKADGARAPGRALVHALAGGKRLAEFPCGVGPDSVSIEPGGRFALIANEGEGFERVDGELRTAPGSLTRIELAADVARSQVTEIALDAVLVAPDDRWQGRRIERKVDGVELELPLENTPFGLEPEVIAFLPPEEGNGLRALVTLQENDAVAVIDVAGARLERYFPLGEITHPADLVEDGHFEERGLLRARREPDGIAIGPGGRWFVTADEGDTVPNAQRTPEGEPAGGGRSLSVFDAGSGAWLGDTGPELDRLAAAHDLYPDKRSAQKGSEPEMVLVLELGSTPYAAVTLERAGALALVDLSDPAHPHAVALAPVGSRHWQDEPEGLAHFRDPRDGRDYLYVANEGTGTLGVLRVLR